jgi:hypothetical protein
MDRLNTDNWLVFEDDTKAAEYDDFDEQVQLRPEDAVEHREYVKRIAEEFGFPLSDWTPTIPSRHSSTS